MKLVKVSIGWYASEDGTWAVIGDGADAYVSEAASSSAGVSAGLNTSAEWQVVRDPSGGLREDNDAGTFVKWVGTLREGRAYINEQGGTA